MHLPFVRSLLLQFFEFLIKFPALLKYIHTRDDGLVACGAASNSVGRKSIPQAGFVRSVNWYRHA